MTYVPLAYDDADTTSIMHVDCAACAHEMSLPTTPDLSAHVKASAPSIAYDAFPQDAAKPVIAVSDAAARLANKMHLHWD